MTGPLPQGVEEERDVETGERFLRSEVTGRWYLVTRWIEQDDGRAIALTKEEVEPEAVPDDVGPDGRRSS